MLFGSKQQCNQHTNKAFPFEAAAQITCQLGRAGGGARRARRCIRMALRQWRNHGALHGAHQVQRLLRARVCGARVRV